MNYKWVFKENEDSHKIAELSEKLNNLSPALTTILMQRKIDTFEKAKSFFRPSLEDLHDPFLMKDMDKAVQKLSEAIQENKKILIYGDYDVDGTTSVALLYLFLNSFHPNLGYYIPDRYREGYGISYLGIDYAAENGYSLVIALDCGIKAVEKIKYATNKGVEFIICDHHNPSEKLPEAIAVLDPKRNDCDYPFKELSGCGVGFKLIQAFLKKNNRPQEEAFKYLDLLVVSIASDIVPITGENRVLTYWGLKKLNENPLPGLKRIKELSAIDSELNVSDIVFKMAPRINVAGRIGTAIDSLELLIFKDPMIVENIASKLNSMNTERKSLDSKMTQEALEQIKSNKLDKGKNTTIVYSPDWHKGVVGIVASRLIETYYRPTIVLTETDGIISGSARSVENFSIYEPLEECSNLLENFGGHAFAAGVTLKKNNLQAFIEKFELAVSKRITEDELIPKITIDIHLDFNEIEDKFIRVLKQMAPFGPNNMNPIFYTDNVYDTGNIKYVGKDNNHLRMDLISKDSSATLPAIGFNLGDKMSLIKSGQAFRICYTIEINKFKGTETIQLSIKDIKTMN